MELKLLIEILWRRRRIFGLVCGSIFLTIFVVTMLVTPWYDATAKVFVRRSMAEASLLSSLGMQQGAMTITETDRADYVALATMNPVVQKVIDETNLKRERIRAKIIRAIPFLGWALEKLGVDLKNMEEKITPEKLTKTSILKYIIPRPYVKVTQHEDSDIINIYAVSTKLDEAVLIANSLAKHFVKDTADMIANDFSVLRKHIMEKMTEVRTEYEQSLEDVKKFNETNGALDFDTFTSNIIENVNTLRKNRESLESSMEKTKKSIANMKTQLGHTDKYQESKEYSSNTLIPTLKIQLKDLYLELAERRQKYTPNHPSVRETEEKIENIKNLVSKEMNKVFSKESQNEDQVYSTLRKNLSSAYADLAGQEGQRDAQQVTYDQYMREIGELPKKIKEYALLKTDISAPKDVYSSLHKLLYASETLENLAVSNVYIAEPAIAIKEHRHPALSMNAIIGLMIGSVAGVIVALFAEYIDDRIYTREDVEKIREKSVIGVTPKMAQGRLTMASSAPELQSAFRRIRRNIENAGEGNQRIFVVTSPMKGEGKSMAAARLAIEWATAGKKTLLIEGGADNPDLANYFNLREKPGLFDYLSGECNAEAATQTTKATGLDLIVAGKAKADVGILLESGKMRDLLADARKNYDTVIIDASPALSSPEAATLCDMAGAFVVVAESGKTRRDEMLQCLRETEAGGARLGGVIVNKTAAKPAFL